jgi:hypothetical protein
MEKQAALGTRAVLVPGVLSGEEIHLLDAMYARIREEEVVTSGGATECFQHPNMCGALRCSDHHTCFLNIDSVIDRDAPHILAKVLTLMRRVDQESGWGLLAGEHNIRVCEYHDYTTGGEVCDPRHCDGGKALTPSVFPAAKHECLHYVATLLSSPITLDLVLSVHMRRTFPGSLVTSTILLADRADFTGGDFTMLEADEETVTEFDDFKVRNQVYYPSARNRMKTESSNVGILYGKARRRCSLRFGEVAQRRDSGVGQAVQLGHGAVGWAALHA